MTANSTPEPFDAEQDGYSLRMLEDKLEPTTAVAAKEPGECALAAANSIADQFAPGFFDDGMVGGCAHIIATYMPVDVGALWSLVAGARHTGKGIDPEILAAAITAAPEPVRVDEAMVDSVRADIMQSAAREGCLIVIKDAWVRDALTALAGGKR